MSGCNNRDDTSTHYNKIKMTSPLELVVALNNFALINLYPMTNQESADASLLKINDAMHKLLSQSRKITQSRVAELSGLSVRTIQRHWDEFDIPEVPTYDDVSPEQVFSPAEELSVDYNEIPVYSKPFEIKPVREDFPPNPYRHPKVYLKMYGDVPKYFYMSKDPEIQAEIKEIKEQNLLAKYKKLW